MNVIKSKLAGRSFIVLILLLSVLIEKKSVAGISYENGETAQEYAKLSYQDHPDDYLAAKGIQTLLAQLSQPLKPGARVLDFGSGPGTLSVLYHELGYEVVAVDSSPAMIDEGKRQFPFIHFQVVAEDGPLPFKTGEFDAVFASYVLLEFEDSEKIIEVLKELKRVIKTDAPFISVNRSEAMYDYKNHTFIASHTQFPENDHLISGGRVKIHDRSTQITFDDYFWSDADYRRFFMAAGFSQVQLHYPLGTEEDENRLKIKWESERVVSPLSVYIAI